jgi:glycosyltransferase involved in cell wall biosynthesis
VIDLRPLQDPERAPVTAAYLEGLLDAYAAEPVQRESFVALLRVDRPDPTDRWPGLPVAARRMLPPPPLLDVATPAGDPLLVAGATIGTNWGAGRAGAVAMVHHTAGAAVPLRLRLPTRQAIPLVATILDLAPWQLPGTFQRSAGARFAARLRRRTLRNAAAIIVGTPTVGAAARRLLRVPEERIHVVGFPPRSSVTVGTPDQATRRRAAEHFGLAGPYLAYPGRFDARHDLSTLLDALVTMSSSPPSGGLPDEGGWPPRVAVVGASPEDRAAIARAAARVGVGDLLAFVPATDVPRATAIVSGAAAVVLPVVADAVGLAAIEALAMGVPVVASGVDGLPDLVGDAGLIVPPRQASRLAIALSSVCADGALRETLATRAQARGDALRARSWGDVARETRAVYAAATSPSRAS